VVKNYFLGFGSDPGIFSTHCDSAKLGYLPVTRRQMHTRVRPKEVPFPSYISPEEWAVYQSALNTVKNSNVSFILGGAFALAVYTGKWRDTKDLDLLILEKDRDVLADALAKAGFTDFYDKLPYDRGWIYRATRDGFIVDLIWKMANRRASVDETWFENSSPVSVNQEHLQVVGAEELLWHKLYVMQRERCDWLDIFNLLNSVGYRMDWDRLVERVGEDELLLRGALNVFAWLCPGRVSTLPGWVRDKFQLPDPTPDAPSAEQRHISWLDTRPWFALRRDQGVGAS
jgi:hypothetical protein